MSQTSPPLKLDGTKIYRLTEILHAVFKAADLVWLLSRIGKDFGATAMTADYRKNIFYMLSSANSDGWCGQLLAVILDERSDNQDIQRFAISVGFVHLPGRDTASLEAITKAPDRFQPAIVNAMLQLQRSRWICKIEIPSDSGFGGTGVLVAPDLVLTNHHVIARPGRTIDLRLVECRFDFRTLEDMITIDPGRSVRLHPDWEPLTRRPSRWDGDTSSTTPPGNDELDYAPAAAKARSAMNRWGTGTASTRGQCMLVYNSTHSHAYGDRRDHHPAASTKSGRGNRSCR